jgi:hypothetical protein
MNLARERLNLSPEQEHAMRGAVTNALQTGSENLRKLLAGEATYDEVPTLEEWSRELEQEILATLTPKQQTAYQQLKHQEQVANARMVANTELLLVQGSLGLDTQQQDAMFAVLYDQALRQMETDLQVVAGRPRDPVAAAEWDARLKREQLQGVLSPAQLANYQRLQNGYRDILKGVFNRQNPGSISPKPGASAP